MSEPALPDHDSTAPTAISWPMRLEAYGFRAVAAFARALSVDQASALSGTIWRGIAPWLRRDKRAMRQIAEALPDLSPAEHRHIINRMWRNLGRNFGEAFHLDDIVADPRRITIRASDATMERLKTNRKLVVVSLHTGNWEIASVAFSKSTGIPVTGIYQKLKNPLVNDDVVAMRAQFYPLGLFPKGKEAIVKMLRIVKQGGAAALLADLRDFRGLSVPFFHRPAPSTPIPAMLSVTQDAPILIGRVIRKDGAFFEVEFKLMEFTPTGERDADIAALTALIHRQFETWIREYPDQWMWGHRRWG